MDPGLYGLAFFVSIPIAFLMYAMGLVLRKEWRRTREKEEAAKRPGVERRLDRLLKQAQAQELAMEESAQRLEEQVEGLDRVREEHGRRLESLEAVVVGQVGALPARPVPTGPHEVEAPSKNRKPTKKLNRTRTARLARQVDR